MSKYIIHISEAPKRKLMKSASSSSIQYVNLKEYFESQGYVVSWTNTDPAAVYINDVRIGESDFGLKLNGGHFTVRTDAISNIEAYIKENQSEILETENGLINVRNWITNNNYILEEYNWNPDVIYVNGHIISKNSFKTRFEEKYDSRHPKSGLFDSQEHLEELTSNITNLDYEPLPDNATRKERIDYFRNIVEEKSFNLIANSEEEFNQQMHMIQGWIRSGDSYQYEVEEITDEQESE